MTTNSLHAVVSHARRISGSAPDDARSDEEILESFLRNQCSAAFNTLFRRHGRLVRSVCRQILRSDEDVEDAVQAVFLVLALKAGSIRRRNSLSSWLYGVAFKTAMSAHKTATRRHKHERRTKDRSSIEPETVAAGRELQAIVAQEVERLPEKYRAPFLLCCLEGRTKAEAARELGWKEGTVSGRLAEARRILRLRLARRGVALSALLCLGSLTTRALAGTKLTDLASAAVLIAAGTPLKRTCLSSKVIALTREVARAMFLSSVKTGSGLLLLGVLTLGAAGNCLRGAGSSEEQIAASEVRPAIPPAPLLVDNLGDPLPEGATARIGSKRFRADSTHIAAFSADGRWLGYGSGDGHVYVCEASSGKSLLEIQLDDAQRGPVTELLFSPDGKRLVAGTFGSKILSVINLKTKKVLFTLPNAVRDQEHHGLDWQYPCSAFIQDGKTLVVGGKDGALRLWSLPDWKEQAVMKAEEEPVLSLSITADGRTALVAHAEGALHFWDLVERRHIRKLDARLRYPHLTLISPDGKLFATETGSGKIELRDREGNNRFSLKVAAELVGLGFTSDSSSLRTADQRGIITTWDVSTGKLRAELTCEGIADGLRSSVNPAPAAWFHSERNVMVWASGNLLMPWDLQTGKPISKWPEFRNGLTWASYAADGKSVRLGGNDGELGVWDAASHRLSLISRFNELRNEVAYMEGVDRRKTGIVVNRRELIRKPTAGDGRIFTWDPTVDLRLHALADQVAPAWYATVMPGGHFLVSTEVDGMIRIYDVATGKQLRSFQGRSLEYAPTFSPDGRLLATCGGNWVIRLYEFSSGRVLREFKTDSPASSLAFSPDGKMLASGHKGVPKRPDSERETVNMVCLWNVGSGTEVRRLPSKGPVSSVCFSPDGKLVASGGFDRIVRIWQTKSGRSVHEYAGHIGGINKVEFSPDGRSLISASYDGTALIWRVDGAGK
jgi:RNA polymerase sigma factor (sigma-70 family)